MTKVQKTVQAKTKWPDQTCSASNHLQRVKLQYPSSTKGYCPILKGLRYFLSDTRITPITSCTNSSRKWNDFPVISHLGCYGSVCRLKAQLSVVVVQAVDRLVLRAAVKPMPIITECRGCSATMLEPHSHRLKTPTNKREVVSVLLVPETNPRTDFAVVQLVTII